MRLLIREDGHLGRSHDFCFQTDVEQVFIESPRAVQLGHWNFEPSGRPVMLKEGLFPGRILTQGS